MTRKRWIYLIGAVGVAAGVLAVIFRPEREPEYGGRKLSEWVDLIWKPKPKGITDERSYSIRRFDETPVAIRSIGTNALPHLLKWSRYEPPSWRGELYRTLNRWTGRLDCKWEFSADNPPAYFRAHAAKHALFMLLEDPNRENRSLITNALRVMDPNAFIVE